MENVYKSFYTNFYQRTGGFIPSAPLNQNLYPGDFFQIRNGEMIVLGNIYQKGIVSNENSTFAFGTKLNPSSWIFKEGVSNPYSERGSGENSLDGNFEFSKQTLAFEKSGSFSFKGNNPESARITNWSEISDELIIKLTQTYYSFRDVYLVTETACASDWTLAISGSENAEMEIATESENIGLVDIFGHETAKTIQSKDIEYYHRESKRKPVFYKAKKLVVQDERLDVFISDLIREEEFRNNWASDFYNYEFDHELPSHSASRNVQGSLLDMLQANELNPNTALSYFRWTNANLDDIEKLFDRYES